MGGADAPAPSLFTCPQLCHQGDLFSITIITAPCAGGLVRFGHFPVDRPTPRRTRPVLEAELLELCRKALHAMNIVLLFFSVPPSCARRLGL